MQGTATFFPAEIISDPGLEEGAFARTGNTGNANQHNDGLSKAKFFYTFLVIGDQNRGRFRLV